MVRESAGRCYWREPRGDAVARSSPDPALGVLGDQIGKQGNVGGIVVQCRDVVVVFAAVLQEKVTVGHRHFFQGFEAVGGKAGADDAHTVAACFSECADGLIGVGLQPGFFAEAGLINELVAFGGQVEGLDDSGCGRFAMLPVGVTFADVAFRHTVEGEEQFFRLAVGEKVAADAGGQGFDVSGVSVPVAHETQFGDAAPFGECLCDAIEDAGGGGIAVLRVHRDDEQFVDVGGSEALQGIADAGATVAHGVFDGNVLPACGKGVAQGDGLPRTDGNQRCTIFLPDLLVGMGATLGAGVEDDAVQDGQPFPARQVNDAWVGEKFAEVGA